MEIQFVSPDLRRLDLFVGEMLVVPIPADQRPPPGLAALLDYRLAGAITQLLSSGQFSGALGEHELLQPRPRLAFDRLLLLGTGPTPSFDPRVYALLLDRIVELMQGAGARRAVIELPGRASERIAPELALDILTERFASDPHLDTWTLVESAETAKLLTARLRRPSAGAWGSR